MDILKAFIKTCLIRILAACFILKLLNVKSAFRLAGFIIKRGILKKRIPGVAILALTYRCQCRCVHCSAGLYSITSEELNVEEWKQVIDQLDVLGVPRLHISGGEPSLKKGFETITEYASSKGIVTFFETNGYSLDRAVIERLKQAGVASIDISFDSTQAHIHDRLRGKEKSFEKALEAAKLCREVNIPCMVSTYATRENIYSGELVKLIAFARKIKASVVRILPPQPSGRWLSNFDVCLKEEDKTFLRSRLPFFTVLDRTKIPDCPIKSRYNIFVAADGELQPCPHLPFSFGNVRDISITDVLDRMAKSPMFEKKSICYLNSREFRNEFIEPILAQDNKLPIKV